MKISTNEAGTLIALATLLDQYNKRSHLTLLFSGVQGIGKSEAPYLAAEKLGGISDVIDGQTTFEGDLSGYLFRKKGKITIDYDSFFRDINEFQKKIDNTQDLLPDVKNAIVEKVTKELLESNSNYAEELDYAKHPVIKRVEKYQEYYYNIAKSTGFRLQNGRVYIDENNNEVVVRNVTNEKGESIEKKTIIKQYNFADHYADGFQNQFEFGENLEPQDKIYLLTSGQIKPFMILVDELNRPDPRVMAEMMNLVLNRRVNGYNIPFWVSLSAAQNPAGADSDYATTELEPAQLDRFAFCEMVGNIEDWAELALSNDIDESYIYSVVNLGEKVFSPDDTVSHSIPSIKPSPRSNMIAGNVVKHFNEVISLPCFSDKDRENGQYYLNVILTGLLGADSRTLILQSMADKDTMVTIDEILTGTSKEIAPDVLNKINRKTVMNQKMLVLSLIKWLTKKWAKILSLKKSANDEDKRRYVNYYQQLADLVGTLEPTIANYFCEKVTNEKYNITEADGTVSPEKSLTYMIYEIINKNAAIFENYKAAKAFGTKR